MAIVLKSPIWNHHQKLLLFVKPMAHFQFRRVAAVATETEGVEAFDNGDVRRLCERGRLTEALHGLNVMDHRGIRPDSSTYASLLQECLNKEALPEGKLVHGHMIDSGFSPDTYLGNKLVIMYAKCGSLADASRVLNGMPERNVIAWTAIIAAYARNGLDETALTLFYQMQQTGIQPNQFTFASVLPACANLGALEHGKKVHGAIIRMGFQCDAVVERTLVDMYIKCGRINDARQVFDKMSERNVVSWTVIVEGYAQGGHVYQALELFQIMPERDVISWNVMIVGWAQNGHLDEALALFQKMPERNVISWNGMIAGCAQNGRVDEALKLFQKMRERNMVSWNGMIAGYAQNGYFNEALQFFRDMQLAGVKPDSITFASVLPACANLAALEHGKAVHEDIINDGFQNDIFVGNALVDMYAKCGRIEDAHKVFYKMPERDVVSWNAIVAGCAQNGHFVTALKLFQTMPERNVVSWNAMIAGYGRNEHVDEALKLFQKMPERDVVSWTATVAGYEQNGYYNEALKLFRQMQATGKKPGLAILSSVLPTCASLSSLKHGKEVHESIIRSGFLSDIFMGTALVDMYAKCGSIEDASRVFKQMAERDVVSWNAMLVGYAMHGYGREALQLFEQMQHSGTEPNFVTFIGVLSACCHAGLVDDGWQYFDRMSREYHIIPSMEHYSCMVDLLGRAGLLDEAHEFINKMPIRPDAAVWGSLLGACRIHNHTELAEHVAEQLFELEPKNAACYVLLSNIYAVAGRWDKVEKVRKMMKDKRVKKSPGCSWIEVNNKVYSFFVTDRLHPQMHTLYAELERLSGKMKEAGYMPNTNLVLHDVEEEQKEHILWHHSEKLAIAFGLIHTSPGTPIRIAKNLRVCDDCHSATQFISKVVAREIVVRDANRFHHFKDGQCSCGDYW